MTEPIEQREFPIQRGQYDDDDESYLPLQDDGFWGDSDDE